MFDKHKDIIHAQFTNAISNYMNIYNLTATRKSKKWLRNHKIDLTALSSALSLLISEVHPSVKVRVINIVIQVREAESSEYHFRTNKIYLCDKPYYSGDSLTRQHRVIFDHILHEFRHWMQSNIYKIGVREIDYTEDDVLNNTNAYYRNRLEIDARQFVRTYLTKFCKYYTSFAKICRQ